MTAEQIEPERHRRWCRGGGGRHKLSSGRHGPLCFRHRA